MQSTFVFIFGLCIGSFLNVCIYRFPRELSIVRPFSFCPKCNKPIKWYDNIPLLSFAVLGRRCRSCKEPIPFRYFIVELLTGLIFLYSYLQAGFSFMFLKYIILFSLCVLVSFIDIDYRAIPGWICILGMLLGISISAIETFILLNEGYLPAIDIPKIPIVKSVQALFLCIGLSYFLKIIGDFGLWIYLNIRKKDSIEGEKEALGLGDVDFLGMVGVFLGWQLGFLTFFLAPLISLVYGIYIIVFRKSHLIAYLPFLSLACLVSAFFGQSIIRFFFSY